MHKINHDRFLSKDTHVILNTQNLVNGTPPNDYVNPAQFCESFRRYTF